MRKWKVIIKDIKGMQSEHKSGRLIGFIMSSYVIIKKDLPSLTFVK